VEAGESVVVSAPKHLFVLRHAKSSWDEPGLDDHDRPLAPRGWRAATALAEHLQASAIEPELVLCSSARRTRETLEGIRAGGEHLIEPELYGATVEDVVSRLRGVPADVDSAMVIGHNPTMQALVLRLAGGPGAAVERVRAKYPTGGLATLTFDSEWSELAPGSARLVGFVRPKELSRS
jgi:phosphohistidine phosphatase